MKQKNLKESDIMNYISEKRKSGKKCLVWTNPIAIQAFRNVAQLLYEPDEHGIGWKFPDNFPHKQTFMGIRHYVGGKWKKIFNQTN